MGGTRFLGAGLRVVTVATMMTGRDVCLIYSENVKSTMNMPSSETALKIKAFGIVDRVRSFSLKFQTGSAYRLGERLVNACVENFRRWHPLRCWYC
ncbi:hypothetical protein JOB18_013897 [Solea senegalensis]|uniref:Uncharacterized protein n=1 Tax=Solea senegalensis TaxID=28829 RepID=A0AAV6T5N1_SOLSE|nr:hypothetical protein JOB18_013897 [Solea senegalensis]